MSGGTTNVINATLAGIITAAQKAGRIEKILAGYHGIKGVLAESLIDITDLPQTDLDRLYYTPASGFIGTSRVKAVDSEKLARLAEVFDAHNIGYFINIGGNGTIKQSVRISSALSSEVNIASVVKTVDNDLGDAEFERVLYTPGFPSCANYWRHKVQMMNQENLGAHSHDKVLIAQTFGRKTGFLAGCARLADTNRQLPLIILLPEDQKPLLDVLEHIETIVRKSGRAIVVMSEGYDVGDIGERYDLCGQVMYGTSRTTSAQLLVNYCVDNGIQARAFIPGFDQRSDIKFVSALDLQRAFILGKETVERFDVGEKDFLASIARNSALPNKVDFISVNFSLIDDYSRVLPEKWVSHDNFDVTDEYVDYVEPLIGDKQVDIPRLMKEPTFIYPCKPNLAKKLKPWNAAFDTIHHLSETVKIMI